MALSMQWRGNIQVCCTGSHSRDSDDGNENNITVMIIIGQIQNSLVFTAKFALPKVHWVYKCF